MSEMIYLVDVTPVVEYLERYMYHYADFLVYTDGLREIEWARNEDHDCWDGLFRAILKDSSFSETGELIHGFFLNYQGGQEEVDQSLKEKQETISGVTEKFITLLFNLMSMSIGDFKQVFSVKLRRLEFYNYKAMACMVVERIPGIY